MLNHLNDPDRRRMPIAEWPSGDRQAWERATSAVGLRAGAAYKWRPDSQTKVWKAWGGLLTFLERNGDLDRSAAPETRVTPLRVETWVRALQARSTGDVTIAGLVLDAGEATRVMVPRFDASWLYELHQRLAAEAVPVRDKRQRIRHPWEVLDCAVKIMHDAPNRRYRERDHWLAEYRDGAFLALVATRPLRRRTLWQLRYGYELRRDEAGYVLDVDDKLLKTGGYWMARVPNVITPWLDRYFTEIRPQMLKGRVTDRVWVTTDGTDMSELSMYLRIRALTLRELGVAMNLHAFRDCMMTAIAIFDPKNVAIGQFMLQQRSPRSGTKFYNLAGKVEAAQRCQETIADLRKRIPDPKRLERKDRKQEEAP